MARHSVGLTLVEMYAIKHALQKQVNMKNKRLELLCTESILEGWDGAEVREAEFLNKDIRHEKALITRFDNEIKRFKEAKRII